MATAHRTLNVSVTRRLDEFVNAKVESGDYPSSSDVVRDALELLEQREREHVRSLAQLRTQITLGLSQLRRGEGLDSDAFFDELEKRLDSAEEPRKPSRRRGTSKSNRQ